MESVKTHPYILPEQYGFMEPTTIALCIILVGALLVIGEAFSPGVYMIIPGTVLVALGLFGYFFPDYLFSIWAPITMLVVGLISSIITVIVYRKLGEPEPPSIAVSDGLIGRKGIVTVKTTADNIKGKVKIGSEIWSARSLKPIDEGKSVIVVSAEGVHVVVEECTEE